MKTDTPHLAAKYHYGFLPCSFTNDVLDIAVKIRPFRELGGDYCSIFQADENRVTVCMCDVFGHDITSALLAARVNTFVLTHAPDVRHPCDLIESLNRFLCDNFSGNLLYTSFYSMSIDLDTMEIDFAGAGHPPAIHYRAITNDCLLLVSETTPLGIEDPLPMLCAVNRIGIAPDDRIMLYTDGLTDIVDEQGKPFTEQRLERYAAQHHGMGAHEVSERLFEDVVNGDRHTIRDDVLLMTNSVKPSRGQSHAAAVKTP